MGRGARRDDIITLEPALLDLDLAMTPAEPSPALNAPGPVPPEGNSLRSRVEAAQRKAIHAALAACQGNWAAAARRLAVDPSNLHKLARRLGIKR